MKGRYTRIRVDDVCRRCASAPISIEATALLRDEMDGSLVAQVKLRNVGAKPIKAIKLVLEPRDSDLVALQPQTAAMKLENHVAPGEFFGQQTPIRLDDSVSCSFECTCSAVMFSDGTGWECGSDVRWERIVEQRGNGPAEKHKKRRGSKISPLLVVAPIALVGVLFAFSMMGIDASGPSYERSFVGAFGRSFSFDMDEDDVIAYENEQFGKLWDSDSGCTRVDDTALLDDEDITRLTITTYGETAGATRYVKCKHNYFFDADTGKLVSANFCDETSLMYSHSSVCDHRKKLLYRFSSLIGDEWDEEESNGEYRWAYGNIYGISCKIGDYGDVMVLYRAEVEQSDAASSDSSLAQLTKRNIYPLLPLLGKEAKPYDEELISDDVHKRLQSLNVMGIEGKATYVGTYYNGKDHIEGLKWCPDSPLDLEGYKSLVEDLDEMFNGENGAMGDDIPKSCQWYDEDVDCTVEIKYNAGEVQLTWRLRNT